VIFLKFVACEKSDHSVYLPGYEKPGYATRSSLKPEFSALFRFVYSLFRYYPPVCLITSSSLRSTSPYMWHHSSARLDWIMFKLPPRRWHGDGKHIYIRHIIHTQQQSTNTKGYEKCKTAKNFTYHKLGYALRPMSSYKDTINSNSNSKLRGFGRK
jgi:hypothetical protein